MRSQLAQPLALTLGAPPRLSVREQLDVARFEDYLGDFTAAAWPHAGEPQNFQSNWHIDCMVDYLMAVARREIRGPGRLIFTLRPRHMKSRGVNVFFPAWVWAQDPDPAKSGHGLTVRPGTLMGPGIRFAHLSYVSELSEGHSNACRTVIESDWYQGRWGERCSLHRRAAKHLTNWAG